MTVLDLAAAQWVSLFSGYGGLDEGIRAVAGGELVAVAEYEPPTPKIPNPKQAPARVLAHRFPHVPNLGDVSEIDWSPWRGRVHGVAGGFPCQDVSHAGLRNGMMLGTRSGLWYEFARAITELQPALVVIENVPGLRSARAGDPNEVEEYEVDEDASTSDMELVARVVGKPERGDRPVLRAFGAVLGDLAELGFDAEWVSVRASDVGASHRRERVFIVAYDRALTRIERGGVQRLALLPSPTANIGSNGGPQDPEKRRAGGHSVSIEDAVSMLPTPLGSDGVHGGPNQRGGKGDLRLSSVEALFPTPAAKLADSGQDTARAVRSTTDGGQDLATAVELLPTPVAHDAKGGKTPDQVAAMRERTGAGVSNLNEVVELLPSPTVAIADGGQTSRSGDRADEQLLGGIVEGMVPDETLLPTPSTSNRDGNTVNNRGELLLPGVAEALTDPTHYLPTPVASEAEKATYQQDAARKAQTGQVWLTNVVRTIDDYSLLPTPTTEPNTGNGHARDLSGELNLLPTPAASQHNDGEDAEQWQARADRLREQRRNGNGAGTPLPIAVQQTGDDGPEDVTADGEPVRWGKYRAAIIRAQAIAGRLAPSPTQPDGKGGKRRLAARFVEWMMILPYGWVTDVPGLNRRDMLKMLGNGVVPAQASVAMLILLDRIDARLAERRAA